MSAETVPAGSTVPVARFLIQPFTARTWKETLYLLLSMPVGIVTFVVLVTGLATGAGLLITLLGIPIIWLTLVLARSLADLERIRARVFLEADVARLYLPDAKGWWKRLISRTEDPSTWLDIVYGILLLPIGVFTFAITVTVWTLGLASALLPLYYWALPKGSASSGTGIVVFSAGGIGQRAWVIDTAPEIAAVTVFGVLIVLLCPWIVRGMASASRGMVQAMLGGGASRQMSKRVRELTDSRTSAVDMAAADRRQIERDLHDGVQQRLVALAMDLGRAQEKFDRDPEGAKALLDDAHVEAKQALIEVRDLARGIYPAVLTDRGLDPALSALAAHCPIPVDVSVEVEPRPPASVEAAAYFVVSEALANIAKHAHAARASVTVRRARDAWLTIQVQDDGVGGADPADGTGLAGLRERVSTLDGEFHLLSPEGGPTGPARGVAVRVVIAEDAVLLREGLARLLEDGGFEVAATVDDAIGLVTAVERERPDVCVVDVRMPPTHTDEGLRAAIEIRARWPGTAVLVLSQYVEERYATELLSGDTRGVGYLLKDRVADVREFLDALRRVAGGGTALDPEVVAQLLARSRRPRDQLTPRESEVLALMAEGRSNAGIAERLVVTEGAVEKHVSSIFAKLQLAPTGSDHRRVLAVLAYLDGR